MTNVVFGAAPSRILRRTNEHGLVVPNFVYINHLVDFHFTSFPCDLTMLVRPNAHFVIISAHIA